MSKRATNLYLQDILNSIIKIEEFIKGFSYEQFMDDEKTTEAVIRKLEIIGEAAKHLPKDFISQYSEIPWGKMVSMRNKVLHEYFGVDDEILWQTITHDLPILKSQLLNLPSFE